MKVVITTRTLRVCHATSKGASASVRRGYLCTNCSYQ